MRPELKAELTLDSGDYTAAMKAAEQSNDKFGDSSAAVHDKTLANIEAFREAKDMLGDMDSSIKGITGAMDHFGWSTEETTHDINNMGEMAAMTEGFMKPFMMFLIIGKARSYEMAAGIGAISTAAMAMGAMVSLSSAKGKKAQATWLAMTSVLWGLTAAQAAFAAAGSGLLAPATAAAIGVAVGLLMAVLGAAAISAKKIGAQSTHRTGTVVQGHSGEDMQVVASRPEGTMAGGNGGRPMQVLVLPRTSPQVARALRHIDQYNRYRSGLD